MKGGRRRTSFMSWEGIIPSGERKRKAQKKGIKKRAPGAIKVGIRRGEKKCPLESYSILK